MVPDRCAQPEGPALDQLLQATGRASCIDQTDCDLYPGARWTVFEHEDQKILTGKSPSVRRIPSRM
jgi:hypothetical protein